MSIDALVGRAQSIRAKASQLLSEAQGQQPAPTGTSYVTSQSGRLLIPANPAPAKAPPPNQALENAVMELGDVYGKLYAENEKVEAAGRGAWTQATLLLSAELRACLGVLTAITAHLGSANLIAGAAAALEGRIPEGYRQNPSGLIVPAKT